MSAHPHDALFRAVFRQPRHLAALLRGVLPPALAAAIDWSTLTPVDPAFIDPRLRGRQGDLLFSARAGARELLLFVQVEHQSQPDPDMPLRLLRYLLRLWERFRRDHPAPAPLPAMLPVVLCHAESGWRGPRSLHALIEREALELPGLAAFLPDFAFVIEDLVRRDDAELAALAPDDGAAVALWLLRDARTAARLFASATHWAPRLRALVRKEQASVAAEQLLSYLLSVLDPDDADRLGEVLAELDPTLEEIYMNERETFSEACYRKGHEAGVRYGTMQAQAEWEARGRAATLLRLLTAKFGAVGPEHRERLERLTIPELDALAERVLTATSLAELFEG